MYCKRCGQQLKDSDRYCQNCGMEVSTEYKDMLVDPVKPRLEEKRELNKTEKTLIVGTGISLALTFFPFHNFIIIFGTVLGIACFIMAALKRDKNNGALVSTVMALSFTAIVLQASWFVFVNLVL